MRLQSTYDVTFTYKNTFGSVPLKKWRPLIPFGHLITNALVLCMRVFFVRTLYVVGGQAREKKSILTT